MPPSKAVTPEALPGRFQKLSGSPALCPTCQSAKLPGSAALQGDSSLGILFFESQICHSGCQLLAKEKAFGYWPRNRKPKIDPPPMCHLTETHESSSSSALVDVPHSAKCLIGVDGANSATRQCACPSTSTCSPSTLPAATSAPPPPSPSPTPTRRPLQRTLRWGPASLRRSRRPASPPAAARWGRSSCTCPLHRPGGRGPARGCPFPFWVDQGG